MQMPRFEQSFVMNEAVVVDDGLSQRQRAEIVSSYGARVAKPLSRDELKVISRRFPKRAPRR